MVTSTFTRLFVCDTITYHFTVLFHSFILAHQLGAFVNCKYVEKEPLL